MKNYRFAVYNWKSNLPAFRIVKPFHSVYYAWIWADKISYKKQNSMYIVVCEVEDK